MYAKACSSGGPFEMSPLSTERLDISTGVFGSPQLKRKQKSRVQGEPASPRETKAGAIFSTLPYASFCALHSATNARRWMVRHASFGSFNCKGANERTVKRKQLARTGSNLRFCLKTAACFLPRFFPRPMDFSQARSGRGYIENINERPMDQKHVQKKKSPDTDTAGLLWCSHVGIPQATVSPASPATFWIVVQNRGRMNDKAAEGK